MFLQLSAEVAAEYWKTLYNRLIVTEIWDALCDLTSFVQFKKGNKPPWKTFTFSKFADYLAALLKLTPPGVCFSRFLNCTNGTKSCKASQVESSRDNNICSCLKNVRIPFWSQSSNSLDTEHILKVHKTFRRCPTRPLNLLLIFNLRPRFRRQDSGNHT